MNRLTLVKIAFVIVGLGLIVMGYNGMVMSNAKPKQLDTLEVAELKKQLVVEGDIEYNLGPYEERYEEGNFGKKVGDSDYYYIIPFGYGKYMGIVVNGDMVNKFGDQFMQYIKVLNNETKEMPEVIHVKGYICKMTNKDYGYFKETMAEYGIPESQIVNYYVAIREFDDWYLNIIIGVVLLLASGAWIIVSRARTSSF